MFCLRPAAKVPADPTAYWYECALVGKEKLRIILATMCREAGIAPKTNHGLRATGATALFNVNVLKKMIRDVTGHHSNSLQLYEHPTLQQKQSVSSVLVQGKPTMEAGKENHHPVSICHALGSSTQLQQVRSLNEFSSLFSGLSHCNFVMNVGALPSAPVETPTTSASTDGGIKELLSSYIDVL